MGAQQGMDGEDGGQSDRQESCGTRGDESEEGEDRCGGRGEGGRDEQIHAQCDVAESSSVDAFYGVTAQVAGHQ